MAPAGPTRALRVSNKTRVGETQEELNERVYTKEKDHERNSYQLPEQHSPKRAPDFMTDYITEFKLNVARNHAHQYRPPTLPERWMIASDPCVAMA